jgi:hypothetical protein
MALSSIGAATRTGNDANLELQPTRVLAHAQYPADNALRWSGGTFAQPALRCLRISPGWLVDMGYRSTLAVVLAVALFAVAWAVCDQLAGLGVGASCAVAGALAIVTFGLTLRMTRPQHLRVQPPRSAQTKPNGLGRQVDAQLHGVFVERPSEANQRWPGLPENRKVTSRPTSHARDMPVREQTRTLVTPHMQFIVDDAGMQVQRRRKTVGGEVWKEHLRISWCAVTSIGFATGRHDPIVALYAWPAAGKPNHVADSRLLNDLEWTQLGELVAEATCGRLALDVGGRYTPKSIWRDG